MCVVHACMHVCDRVCACLCIVSMCVHVHVYLPKQSQPFVPPLHSEDQMSRGTCSSQFWDS